MSGAADLRESRRERSPEEIAGALRSEWRMIAAVSLRPRPGGVGFDAALRLDPIVAKGSLEQQGYPRTPAALAKLEERRRAALEECVKNVNSRFPAADAIQSFAMIG